MTVIVPCDYYQTKAATKAIANYEGPVYLGLAALHGPFYKKKKTLKLVKPRFFWKEQMFPFCLWPLGMECHTGRRYSSGKGISVEVINIHTVKPLDEEAVLKSLRKTKCAVTAEEHNIIGGMGDAIAQCAGKKFPGAC